MPRCRQFSEDREEPSAGKMGCGDKAAVLPTQAWRHREGRKLAQPRGRELFGASLGVAPQSQPLWGMLLRPSTNICPKELTRDMRGFFNSLLRAAELLECLGGSSWPRAWIFAGWAVIVWVWFATSFFLWQWEVKQRNCSFVP